VRYFLVVAALAAFLLVAGGEYLPVHEDVTLTVLTDEGGDSTTGSGTQGIGPVYGFKTLVGQFILKGPLVGSAHVGDLDSGWLQLYSTYSGNRTFIDSASSEGLPCTLTVALTEAVGDTALKRGLELDWEIYDSCGDTAYNEQYQLKWNYILK
jgi:hypothetical protein